MSISYQYGNKNDTKIGLAKKKVASNPKTCMLK